MPWTLSAFADEAGPTTHEQIAALERSGLTRIDPRGLDGHNISGLPQDLAEQIHRQYQQAGITVNMFGSPIGKIDVVDDVQSDLDKLEQLGRLKDIFDCHAVRIFSYYNKKAGLSWDDWRQRAMDNLKRLQDTAGRLGLVLYHENESDIYGDHADQVSELAEMRDGQTFKLIYDFANYLRTGESGQETWRKMKDKTDYLHFKDQTRANQHVPIGKGDTDAPAILEDAVHRGLEFGCTLEPHLTHSDAVAATHASGKGDQSLKDLPPAETFDVAAEQAKALLAQVGVRV